ncbi:MAG: alpha/beta hydrolase [Candidatus Limiplasma sp.]|nr:alpha/beta hydrolase [Candidatus Limiplasma sp.]
MQSTPKPRPNLLFIILMLLVYMPMLLSLAMAQAKWYGWLATALSFLALLWMHGRPFWHTWRIALCFIGAYMVAFLGLYAARPAWDVSLAAQISSGLVRTFTSLPQQERAMGEAILGERGWQPPAGYTLQTRALPHAKLELLTKEGAANDRAVLQFHGGAFVAGLYDLYRDFAVRYATLYGDALVASLDYRLAPAYPYPSQQEDAMDAWRYLTDTLGFDPARIIVAGDSAGGNLALSLGLRLRDAGQAMPGGFVVMSPWADLSNSGASHTANATADPSFGIAEKDFHGQAIGVPTTYPDGLDARDPYLSPSFGDYAGFPPMLLQAGSVEVLLSDSEMVYYNAKQHGVDCRLTVYNGMFHVFQGAMDLLPESRLAWEEIGLFLAERMAAQ